MTRQCHGVTRNGTRCKNSARNNKAKYCARHAPSTASSSLLGYGVTLDVKKFLKDQSSDDSTPRKRQKTTQTPVDISEVLGDLKIVFSDANATLIGLPEVLYTKTSGIPKSISAKVIGVSPAGVRNYDIKPLPFAKLISGESYEEKKSITVNNFRVKYSISITSDEDEKEMNFKFQLISLRRPNREIFISLDLTDPNEPDDDDKKGLEGYFRIQGFDEGFKDAAEAEEKNPFAGFER